MELLDRIEELEADLKKQREVETAVETDYKQAFRDNKSKIDELNEKKEDIARYEMELEQIEEEENAQNLDVLVGDEDAAEAEGI